MNKPNAEQYTPDYEALFASEIKQSSTSDGIIRARKLANYIVELVRQNPSDAQRIINTHLQAVKEKISGRLAEFVSGSISEQLQGLGFTEQDMLRRKVSELLNAKNYDGRYQSQALTELVLQPLRDTKSREDALHFIDQQFGKQSFMAQAVRAQVAEILKADHKP